MSGIYIHIPYCHSKCAYCDFYSMPLRTEADPLVDCLIKEYDLRKHELTDPASTIYIGGGTPSILPAESLRRLISALPTDRLTEFTIEANPEDITPDLVKAWRDMGIDRVSMGVQSLIDRELSIIGRNHTSYQAYRAVDDIRAAGIHNISLDLIYGLPTQTIDSWKESMMGIFSIRPMHLSAYILSYEPHTRLTAMLKTGKIQPVEDDVIVDMYRMLTSSAHDRGYGHYEISNFALWGYEAKHNSSYWDGTPYLGIGPAAHSYDGKVRRYNPYDLKQYIDSLSRGATVYTSETETKAERYNGLVMTSLRTSKGLQFDKVPIPRRKQLLSDAYPYLKREQLILEDNHLRIPEHHWLISDAIIRDLMQ